LIVGETGEASPSGGATPSLPTLLAVSLVAGCTLALQVVLTRLFSAVLPYHFTYLAISLAFLGTGGGGLAVYLRPAWFAGAPERNLARWSVLFALLLVLAPLALARLDFTYGKEAFDYDTPMALHFGANLLAACVVSGLPSFAAGVVIALAIERFAARIGLVYAFDLAGAGLGALGVVPLLWLASAPALLVGLALGAAFAAGLLAGRRRAERAAAAGAALLALLVLAVGAPAGWLHLPFGYALPEGAVLRSERWTPLGRVTGFELPGSQWAAVFFDRVYAPVPVVRDGDTRSWDTLYTGPQSIGYALTGPGHTLIIGGGGGRDIHTALAAGQSRVDVIELNGAIRRVVDEDLRDLSGAPYSRPAVRTRIGDGRSVLAASSEVYDQIHVGFTDTLSSGAAQGMALVENNLYTLESFSEFLDHLSPRGVLNVSRLLRLVGDEALRATVLTLAALEARGVPEPARHVVVVLGRDIFGEPFGTVLARLAPWSQQELERIHALAAQRGEGVAFAPGAPGVGPWRDLARAPSVEDFCRGYPLDVCPPTDDRPFFFNMHRLGTRAATGAGYLYAADPSSILLLTLAILVVLSGVAFALPLGLVRETRRPTASSLAYFAAIGVGFLVLEVALIQRFVLFLGFPTYALSVVLFGLLVWTGLGSWLTTRARDERRALLSALAGATVLVLGCAFGLQALLRALIGLPFAVRVALALLLLAPFGLLLGMPMPLGLRRFGALHPRSVAYAWGVNGVASVLASVLAVAVALHFGFAVASLVAGACYLFAFGHAALGRWPEAAALAAPATTRGSAQAARTGRRRPEAESSKSA
jgi:hypothetical protein